MSKTSKELEGKLAELQAASVEAGVEFKRIDEQIEQAKLDFGQLSEIGTGLQFRQQFVRFGLVFYQNVAGANLRFVDRFGF